MTSVKSLNGQINLANRIAFGYQQLANNSKKPSLLVVVAAALVLGYVVIFKAVNVIADDSVSHTTFAPVFASASFLLVAFMLHNRARNHFNTNQPAIAEKANMLEKENAELVSLLIESEEQAIKLQSSILLKEKLMSVITHDVRTPMNSFRFLIDNYEKGYITEKMMLEGLLEAKQDVVKMDAMVLDLADWARKGKDANAENAMNLSQMQETMESVLSIYSLCLKNKSLEIVPVIDMPANSTIAISKRELAIVMRNLVSNAIKFSNTGSKIVVSITADKNNSATLMVKDHGNGMHPSVLNRLNGNRMISTLGTANEVGLGIGLSIVFDVIHERNLGYNINSELKKGTEFCITIPAGKK